MAARYLQPRPPDCTTRLIPNPAKPKPHYAEHRDRLRQRFRDGGKIALQDYELLELFLFNSIPRRDVKPIAKELMRTFGNLGEICAAPLHRLTDIKGIGEKTALDLRLLPVGRRCSIIAVPLCNSSLLSNSACFF
jgi:DNA repair protein RadC